MANTDRKDTRSIRDILVFYSNYSQRCELVKRYVASIRAPLSMICIDRRGMRVQLSKVKDFKLRGVPTLVVIYDTEGTQDAAEVFEGDKVLAWLYDKFGARNVTPPPPTPHPQPKPPVKKTQDPPTEGLYSPPRKSRSTKDSEDEPQDEPKPKNFKQAKIDSIKNLAREMEEQRRKALGIDENGNTIRKRRESDELEDDED